jgi:hypothetical protein
LQKQYRKITLNEADGRWPDIGGAAGMLGREPGSVGVGDGEGGLAGASVTESAATGGVDSGGAGGAGRSTEGEAGISSSNAGGIEGGDVVGSDAVGGIGERSSEDGESDGGEAIQDRGERTNSLSPSGPRNSSASLRRLLVLLAGGVVTSGGETSGCERGTNGLGLEGGGGGVDVSPPTGLPLAGAATAGATVTEAGRQTVLVPTWLAVRPRLRRRRRRLAAVAVIVVDIGRLQDTVTT